MHIKKIYLIRHGETVGNKEKRYIGSKTDEELSEEGISKLKPLDCSVERVYSSPMKRCIQTAGLIFGESLPAIIEDLREINFGDFEGKNYRELSDNPDYQRWIDSGGSMPFPNGESREDFIKRSFKAFTEIVKTDNSEKIAIVCHGGNIMSVMSKLTGKDYFDFQAKCGEGYALELKINEEGEVDEISYHSLSCGTYT